MSFLTNSDSVGLYTLSNQIWVIMNLEECNNLSLVPEISPFFQLQVLLEMQQSRFGPQLTDLTQQSFVFCIILDEKKNTF